MLNESLKKVLCQRYTIFIGVGVLQISSENDLEDADVRCK
jgi:hypothetical protein